MPIKLGMYQLWLNLLDIIDHTW